MAGLFKAGDSVLHVFSEAIPGHERVVDGEVIAEISPGQYQIATNLGIAVVVPEEKLALFAFDIPPPVVPVPVPPEVAAILANTEAVKSNTDAIHGKDIQASIDAAAGDVQAMADNLAAATAQDQAVQAKLDAAAADIRAAVTRLTEA
jgi:hypothetical protein